MLLLSGVLLFPSLPFPFLLSLPLLSFSSPLPLSLPLPVPLPLLGEGNAEPICKNVLKQPCCTDHIEKSHRDKESWGAPTFSVPAVLVTKHKSELACKMTLVTDTAQLQLFEIPWTRTIQCTCSWIPDEYSSKSLSLSEICYTTLHNWNNHLHKYSTIPSITTWIFITQHFPHIGFLKKTMQLWNAYVASWH